MRKVQIHPEICDGHDGFDRAVAKCGYVDIDLDDVEMTVLLDTIDATIKLSNRSISAPYPVAGGEVQQGLTPVLEMGMYDAMSTIARDLRIALASSYGEPTLLGPRPTITGDEGADAVRRGTSAISMAFRDGLSGLTLRPDVARGFNLMGLMIYAVALPDIFVENLARKLVDDEEAENIGTARVIAEARWGSEQIDYRRAMHTLRTKLNDIEPRWPSVTTMRARPLSKAN